MASHEIPVAVPPPEALSVPPVPEGFAQNGDGLVVPERLAGQQDEQDSTPPVAPDRAVDAAPAGPSEDATRAADVARALDKVAEVFDEHNNRLREEAEQRDRAQAQMQAARAQREADSGIVDIPPE